MKKMMIQMASALALALMLTACGGEKAAEGETSSTTNTSVAVETSQANSDESTEAEENADAKDSAQTSDGAALQGTALEDKVLDIGTNATFPPFEYYEGQEMVGADVEIMQAIADTLGYQLEMHDMDFDAIIPAIESGKLDGGIAGFSITEERKKSVNFSNEYAQTKQCVLVLKDSGIQKVADLEGKKIGSQLGTTGEAVAQEKYGESNVTGFKSFQDAVLAMTSGKLSAVVVDELTAENFTKANDKLVTLGEAIASESYAIAFPKTAEVLTQEVNAALEAITESGKLQEILDKYQISAME